MKILLTGANGYIGKKILPLLVAKGYNVVCCVRNKERFNISNNLLGKIEVIELDLLKEETLSQIPKDINIAFYLVHSMSSSRNYHNLEFESANNFRQALEKTNCHQVIYLSGIVNDTKLSEHLSSRLGVEKELSKGNYHLSTLRAGIIVGSGSASFEIIRDLVEKLPIMVAPRWLETKCQPIAIDDAVSYLVGAIGNKEIYDKNFDIGGPDILTYKEMLLEYAKVRGLKRKILIVPVMTPKLSSYWLYFVTATSYKLATALVDSMKVEIICQNSNIKKYIKVENIAYSKAIEKIFSFSKKH